MFNADVVPGSFEEMKVFCAVRESILGCSKCRTSEFGFWLQSNRETRFNVFRSRPDTCFATRGDAPISNQWTRRLFDSATNSPPIRPQFFSSFKKGAPISRYTATLLQTTNQRHSVCLPVFLKVEVAWRKPHNVGLRRAIAQDFCPYSAIDVSCAIELRRLRRDQFNFA